MCSVAEISSPAEAYASIRATGKRIVSTSIGPSSACRLANVAQGRLLVGLQPEAVDYSDPALPPGVDAKKIQAGIEQGLDGGGCRVSDGGWAKAPALTNRRSTAADANFFMSASCVFGS